MTDAARRDVTRPERGALGAPAPAGPLSASYGLGPSAALQLKRPAQIPPARALRPMSSLLAPARIRAMLAGDPQTTRAFVELLFHGRGPAAQ